jgi:hypothetical protein
MTSTRLCIDIYFLDMQVVIRWGECKLPSQLASRAPFPELS